MFSLSPYKILLVPLSSSIVFFLLPLSPSIVPLSSRLKPFPEGSGEQGTMGEERAGGIDVHFAKLNFTPFKFVIVSVIASVPGTVTSSIPATVTLPTSLLLSLPGSVNVVCHFVRSLSPLLPSPLPPSYFLLRSSFQHRLCHFRHPSFVTLFPS